MTSVLFALIFTVLSLTGCEDGSKIEQDVFKIKMVSIPDGSFIMGSPIGEEHHQPDEIPRQQVTLSGFHMGKYEVTQAEYETVMGSLPDSLIGTHGKGDNYPVYHVSWYDALVFCNKLNMLEGLSPAYRINGKTDPDEWGAVPTSSNAAWNAVEIISESNGYRLPTEAQWEYACRAGTMTPWHSGETNDNLGNYAWMSGNSGGKSHEAGKKQPNAWGLYDMYGNVWEWCWDWYDSYPANLTDPENPTGPSSGSDRVNRGGSWISSVQDVRSASRYFTSPSYRGDVGFRVVRP